MLFHDLLYLVDKKDLMADVTLFLLHQSDLSVRLDSPVLFFPTWVQGAQELEKSTFWCNIFLGDRLSPRHVVALLSDVLSPI